MPDLAPSSSDRLIAGFTLLENLIALALLSGALAISAIGMTRAIAATRLSHEHQRAIGLIEDLAGRLTILRHTDIDADTEYGAWQTAVAQTLPRGTANIATRFNNELAEFEIRLTWAGRNGTASFHEAVLTMQSQ